MNLILPMPFLVFSSRLVAPSSTAICRLVAPSSIANSLPVAPSSTSRRTWFEGEKEKEMSFQTEGEMGEIRDFEWEKLGILDGRD